MSEAKKLQLVGTFVPKEVDADKIVFPDGLKTTYAIGNVTLTNGMGTLVEPGGTLEDFFNVFVAEKNPTITQPSIELTFTNAGVYEVGSLVPITYNAKFKVGSYSYGPATGVTVNSWLVSDTAGNTSDSSEGSFGDYKLQVTDDVNYKITVTANHSEGTIPKTNVGKDYAEGKIEAGSVTTVSKSITGSRAVFYGVLYEKNDMDSSVVRTLTGSKLSPKNGTSFDLAVLTDAKRVVIAYPDTLRDLTSVIDVNGMNARIESSFKKQIIDVEGVNSYTAISYKVYTLDFANPITTANTYKVTI